MDRTLVEASSRACFSAYTGVGFKVFDVESLQARCQYQTGWYGKNQIRQQKSIAVDSDHQS
jgi:hypothetical protein